MIRLTPKGRVYIGAAMRYMWVPNPRQMYMTMGLLILGAFLSWSISETLLAVYSVLMGAIIGFMVMAILFRKMLQDGEVTLPVDTQGVQDAMKKEQFKAEIRE